MLKFRIEIRGLMITTKGRYALRVMVDLAEHRDDGLIPLKDIAERQEISKKYLEIIARELVSGDLICGVSGKGGGYKLVRDPSEYNLGEILERMEGTLAPVACLECGSQPCPRKDVCKTLPVWQEYDALTRSFFYGRTLGSLLRESVEKK